MSVSLHQPIGHRLLRDAFGHFPTGVAALAATVEGTRHVLIASSFTVGVSLDPPLAAVFIQKRSSTWTALSTAHRIGVSVLGAGHDMICRQLTDRDKTARFFKVPSVTNAAGAIQIEGAAAWFECSVFDTRPAGDHDGVLLLIHDLHVNKETAPLVFHGSRFTRLMAKPAEACL